MEIENKRAMTDLKLTFHSYEKIPVSIWSSNDQASVSIANSIADAIKSKQEQGKNLILGLATGSSPIKVYKELVRMHREEGLSFSNVITFNLDEYYPMQPDSPQSYVHFMNLHLFNHIDIKKENIHIPDGTVSIDKVEDYVRQYEEKMDSMGGIDIQILGIGRSGHIGFNEPGSRENSLTRVVRLDEVTKRDAIKDFVTLDLVPRRAITMGIQSILKAKTIYIMAWGSHKADVVKEAIEGPISSQVTASFLQNHPDTKFFLDSEAASQLAKIHTPWLVGMCSWNEDLICRAVVWLSGQVDKPILKLTDSDYNENGLSELIDEYGSAYSINLIIFNRFQHTITGWPGGKPNADDKTRPERAEPARKRVIIFSPHPDDDVISMGGTFLRLVDQGHDVHVAYQTSGNVAVHDHDAIRFLEFFQEFGDENEILTDKAKRLIADAQDFLESKTAFEKDTDIVRNVKGLIRRGEARAGAKYCGLDDDHIHFLNLPFYETGRVSKNEMSSLDLDVMQELLEKIQPHQVFAAGDLADPHGTHRICLDIILESLRNLADRKWMDDCWVWLYRGAWHEWPIDEIEMVVPLSPKELSKKRQAIYMHQSQKDSPPFPGNDQREFWQRAEDRNRETAERYSSLGFASYEAMEAFRRYRL